MQREYTYHLMVVVWYTRFLKECAESSLQNRGKNTARLSNLTAKHKLIQYLAFQLLVTLQRNLLSIFHCKFTVSPLLLVLAIWIAIYIT